LAAGAENIYILTILELVVGDQISGPVGMLEALACQEQMLFSELGFRRSHARTALSKYTNNLLMASKGREWPMLLITSLIVLTRTAAGCRIEFGYVLTT
jgi:hypothetical protein